MFGGVRVERLEKRMKEIEGKLEGLAKQLEGCVTLADLKEVMAGMKKEEGVKNDVRNKTGQRKSVRKPEENGTDA